MTIHRMVAIAAAAVFSLGGYGLAQSPALPATHPTAAQPAGPRAKVVYAKGQLEVIANNASLNQLLHEIAVRVGIKIQGGVVDQPVYGTYGPATPAEVLAALLDGTGSNMLLTTAASGSPAELVLVLTPRLEAPTAPAPDAAAGPTQPNPQAAPAMQAVPSASVSTANPSAANPGGASGTSAANPADTAQPPARTQQQIYEHAQQLRALQHQQPPQ